MIKILITGTLTFILGLFVGATFLTHQETTDIFIQQDKLVSVDTSQLPNNDTKLQGKTEDKANEELNSVDSSTGEEKQTAFAESEEKRALIAESETEKLEEVTNRLYRQLAKNAELADQLAYTRKLLSKNNIPYETVSLEDLEVTIPKEYLPYFKHNEALNQQIKQMLEQNRDESWAFNIEQQINDFILLHENYHELREFSVTCYSHTCEMKGYEETNGSFGEITKGMAEQPFWKFNRSTSTSGLTGPNGKFFYMLVSIE